MAKRMSWNATVGCEGGPLMVASAKDFARWPGALGTSRPKTTLWYYGHAVDELPERFRPDPDGGHQWLHHETTEAARQTMAELRDALVAKFPDTKVTEDEFDMHLLLPDRRAIEVKLGPQSEYDEAWQSHQEEETWTHVWGKEDAFRSFFWELEGGCVVQIGVSEERDEVVMIQSWVDEEEEDEAKVRALVEAGSAEESDSDGELVIPSGHTVFVWSPTSVLQLTGFDFETLGFEGFETKLRAMAEEATPPELETDMIAGLGTAMLLKPGRWRARVGVHESDDDSDDDSAGDSGDEDSDSDGGGDWSCRWCRLIWTAA